MKTYYGHAATPERPTWVTVRRDTGLVLLPHHLRSVPADFEWGDSAVPSDLARSILLDAFGVESCPTERCECQNRWADVAYGAFRDTVIARFPQGEDWKLEQEFVVDWTFDFLRATNELDQVESLVPTP